MSDIPTVSGPDYPMGEGPTTIPAIKGYKIIQQLGEGGMGIVYLAKQTEPIKRQVALKVVKPGMDSREVIARFQAERQALAMLDHPNVAHVYDAGTTENGRPYFVMEYINGIPITGYCDQQELSIEERLELFQQVCEGIQHAHQRGIIHRDLKPSNILVISEDGKAIPKVIDFGIAKAIKQELTEKTLFTAQGQLIGTPEYMSPEQADLTSFNVDTRTDVYSLGVILYQLLTGALPFDPKTLRSAAFGEIQRIIREVDPPKPSIKLSSLGAEAKEVAKTRKIALGALTKKLHKELEWIPLKAMRKESDHRYQSISEFAKDIENYLNGSPLLAGPESKLYRIRKYVRRNRVLLASSVIIFIVLVLGILISTYFGLRERETRIAADQANIVAEQKKIEAEKAKEQETKQRQIAQEKAELNRQQLYFMSIKRAAAECERKNIIDALELLENCSEDLRGWEWFYLRKRTGSSQLIYSGGNSIVDSVAFSPDGKRVAWGKEGIIVWDTEKNLQVMNIDSHGLWMDPSEMMNAERSYRFLTKQSVVFSPDGKWLAVGNGDEIKVWEIETGKEILSIICKQVGVSSVAFSPNGKCIASGGKNGTIKIWNATNGIETKTLSGGSNSIYSIAFSPDGTRIVSGEQFGGIKIWDSEKGDIIVTFLGHTYPAEIANSSFREFGIESTAFSPDGKQIVSGDTIFGTIKVWDAIKGTEVMTLSDCSTKNILNKKQKRSYATNSVCFSSDGKSIISAISDGTIRIWDAQSGEETSVIYGHRGGVASVAFSPDGKQVLSGGKKDGKIRIQNIKKEPETISFRGHKDRITSIGFSHDGSCIVSGSRDGTVNMWSSKNYSLLKKFPPRQIEIRPNTYTNAQVLSVAFSPSDEALAIGDEDGVIRIINPENSTEILNLVGDKSGINSIAFSPDGKKIIYGEGSISNPGTVRVWNNESKKEICSFSGSEVGIKLVAVSPNGKWIASSWGRQVKLWVLETQTEMMNLEGLQSFVNSLAFNPESTLIAVAHNDGIIAIWDTKNVTELTFNGFQGNIKSLAFSPDGKRLISVGELGTIKIWDTKTFSEVLTIEGQEAEVNCVAFSPDGTMIVSGDADGVIKIWGAEGSKETSKIQTANSANNDQDLKLITACKMGKIGAVRDTITNGAEVDSRDQYGCTPLQWAADKGYPEIVSFLVGKRADIEAKDDQGKTALMWGAGSGQSIIVQFLLEKGANIDAKDTMWGKTALMWAADKGHIEVVKILLDKGADINTKDFSGKTALIRAKSKKYFDIVKILQEKDAIE